MLAEIRGRLKQKIPGKVWVEAGPLTFEISVPFTLVEELPPSGEEVRLPVCLWVQEGVPELFGFRDQASRETFLLLASLSGVGPRLALNILAFFRPETLEEIVAAEDLEALSRVPGIGPRRAERLCVELRGKLGLKRRPRAEAPLLRQALEALKNLGFPAAEAEEVLHRVYTGQEDLQELLRKALREFSPA